MGESLKIRGKDMGSIEEDVAHLGFEIRHLEDNSQIIAKIGGEKTLVGKITRPQYSLTGNEDELLVDLHMNCPHRLEIYNVFVKYET